MKIVYSPSSKFTEWVLQEYKILSSFIIFTTLIDQKSLYKCVLSVPFTGGILSPDPHKDAFDNAWRHFCSHNWERMFCYWRLVGGDQGCCWQPLMQRTAPHDKEWSGPKCQEYQGWESLYYRQFTKMFSLFSNNLSRCSSDLDCFAALKSTSVF